MGGSSAEESVRVNTSIEACALLDRDGKIRSCEQSLNPFSPKAIFGLKKKKKKMNFIA